MQVQLGNNTTTGSNAPVRVSGGLAYTVYLGDVIQIAAGGDWVNGTNDFAVVLRKDGSVMTWGQNSNGQLGNKSYTSSLTPVRPVGTMVIQTKAYKMWYKLQPAVYRQVL